MNPLVNQYWQERLGAGKIFALKQHVEEGYDIRTSRGGTRDWPERVAKDSLYMDFVMWATKRGVLPSSFSVGSFYSSLEKIAYPYGKNWHTSRHRITRKSMIGGVEAELMTQRAFFKLPSLDIATAWFNLSSARGTMSQREEWRQTVRAYGVSRGADVAAVPHG